MKQWIEQFNGRMDAWGRKLQGKEIRVPIDLVTGIVFALFALVILLVMPDQVAVSEIGRASCRERVCRSV